MILSVSKANGEPEELLPVKLDPEKPGSKNSLVLPRMVKKCPEQEIAQGQAQVNKVGF